LGFVSEETEALLAALDAQRSHVLEAVDGLSDANLRRPVLPSGWTCLGLVQHLALDVERFWFRACVAGEDVQLLEGDAGWRVSAGRLDAVRELTDGKRWLVLG
jgi:Protein of unknown function (DUF664)